MHPSKKIEGNERCKGRQDGSSQLLPFQKNVPFPPTSVNAFEMLYIPKGCSDQKSSNKDSSKGTNLNVLVGSVVEGEGGGVRNSAFSDHLCEGS